MRTIKFRAWHSRMNRIISPEELGADQITLLPSTGQFINVSGDSTFLSTIYPSDKFIPMQFTGLLDKNGKEIYEGDIFGATVQLRAVVVWEDYGWRLQFLDKRMRSGDFSFNHFIPKSECIGNIHENPELLK